MSSILDAVTKDASRSGSIPGAAPTPPSGGTGGPSRFRSAVLVVVVGVALGALAARQFGGGGEPAADGLLTEKATRRAGAEPKTVATAEVADSARPASAPAVPEKGSRKDESAHQRFLAKRKADAAAAAARAGANPEAGAGGASAAPASPPPLVIPAPPSVAKAPAEPGSPVGSAAEVPAAATPTNVAAPAPALPVEPSPPVPVPVPGEAPPPVVAARAVPATPPIVAAPPPVPAPGADAQAAAAQPGIIVGGPSAAVPAPAAPTAIEGQDAAAAPPAEPEAPAPAPAPPEEVVLDGPPTGAPEVMIMFVAWSRTPSHRMVSLRVGQGALSVVHEGEYVEGLQVSTIHPESVDLQWTGQRFRVPVRAF